MREFNVYLKNRCLYLNEEEVPQNKIALNKYENEDTILTFVNIASVAPRRYCALKKPDSDKYFILKLTDKDQLIIGTDISAYPGKWELLLIGTSDDYIIENDDIDQSRFTFISNHFDRIYVRDNYLEELDFEEQTSPTFKIFYDDILDRLELIEEQEIATLEVEGEDVIVIADGA